MEGDARKELFACEAGRRSCLVEAFGIMCLNMVTEVIRRRNERVVLGGEGEV